MFKLAIDLTTSPESEQNLIPFAIVLMIALRLVRPLNWVVIEVQKLTISRSLSKSDLVLA